MKKIFSLFAAMCIAIAVNAQTDFAGGYNCTADDAVLSNVYGLSLETTSNPHCILCNEATWNVVLAKWTVQASRGCYVTVSLDMGAAQGSNKHIFEVKISDSKGNAKGTLVEAKENAVADDVILLDGTILLPAAGEYTVELTSRRQYGKGRIKNVILTYDSDAPSEIIEVSAIELDKTELTLELQEVELLTATVSPDNATDPSVTWESDDEAVATVSATGLVKAIAEGTANIKAKAGEKEAVCAVIVSANTVPEVDFNTPCVLSGKNALIEGNVWKNEAYKLYWNNKSTNGTATWNIHVTRPCTVSGVLNAVEGGHLYLVELYEAEGVERIDYMAHSKAKEWPGACDQAIDSVGHNTLTFPKAGDYRIVLTNEQKWSSGKCAGITLTAPKTLYLKPGIWNQGNEKFAIWDITNEKWSEFMVLAENETEIYTAEVAADAEKVIFARINGEAAAPNWDAKWNQTENLDILEGKDMFEISCWNCSEYGNSDGAWSKYVAPTPVVHTYTVAGNEWITGHDWDPAATENDMILQSDGTYKLECKNVTLFAGDYPYKVAIDHIWNNGEAEDNSILSIGTYYLAVYDLTFTYNPATKETNAVANLVEITPPSVDIYGEWNKDGEGQRLINKFIEAEDHLTCSYEVELAVGSYACYMEIGGTHYSKDYEIKRDANVVTDLKPWDPDMTLNADVAGKYIFTWNYMEEKLTVTYPEIPLPSYIAINGDWNGWVGNPMVLSSDKKTASVTVSLDMGEYNGHGFKIQLDDKSYCIKQDPWYAFHRDHTQASGIDDVAGDEDAFWLSMDVAGDYTFTWTLATKTLEITFPAEPKVVALAGSMNAWSATANVFENSTDGKTASLAITFDDYYYEFKLVVNGKWLSVNGTDGYYRLHRGNTSVSGLEEKKDNLVIAPDLIGAEYEYVFTWNYETGVLNVDFPEPKLENGWYLVGTFGGVDEWGVDKLSAAKKFDLNDDETECEEYKITVPLKVGDKFKAAYVYLDALQGDSYKPGGDSGDFTVDANHAGSSKAIYLRPNGDGGDDWYYHVLFVHANDTPMAVDNTEDGVTAKKVVENGMLIIEKNNVRYTVTGQVIR